MISKSRATKNCPKCFTNESQEEKELISILNNKYGFSFLKFKDKDSKLEIDGYDSDLKIGIEFNGLYWHSNIFNSANKHNLKREYFERKGIKIINIFENDFLNNKDETIQKILNTLNGIRQKENFITINLQYENSNDYPGYIITEKIPPKKHYIDPSTFKKFIDNEGEYFIYDCGYLKLEKTNI